MVYRKEDRETHKKWKNGWRAETRAWILSKKTACVRCGETEPVCLDFHHRDPSTKEFTIGDAILKSINRDRLEKEMAKCDLLCANCHRKEHKR